MAKLRSIFAGVALTAALIAGLTPDSVLAVPIPAPDDRQWLSVGGLSCQTDGSNLGTPTCPEGGTASGFLDHTLERATVEQQGLGVTLKGGGTTDATRLRAFLEVNAGFGRTTAIIEDTYVLTGPESDPVSIQAVLAADGNVQIINRPNGGPLSAIASADIAIGDAMRTSGTGLVTTLAQDNFFTGIAIGPGFFTFDLRASHELTVTPGESFQLAFMLNLANAAGGTRTDALNTATIGFDLPDGYALTSALGFGAASTSVPEPPTLALLGIALAGLGIARRKNKAG